jgi:hypothetical protein
MATLEEDDRLVGTEVFDSIQQYFSERERFWSTFDQLRDQFPNRSYYCTWSMDYAEELIEPAPFTSHRAFVQILQNTKGKATSNLITEMLSGDLDPEDAPFSLSICSGDHQGAGVPFRNYQAYVRRGFMASVTNCVLRGFWEQALYYDNAGNKRPGSWYENGGRKPENALGRLTNPVKEIRRRIKAFTDAYRSASGEAGEEVLTREGLNVRDLGELSLIMHAEIFIWARVGSKLHLRHHTGRDTRNPTGHRLHMLLTRPNHVELIDVGNLPTRDLGCLNQSFKIEYVDTDALASIVRKTDPATKDDLVYILKGRPTSVLSENPSARNRPQDLVLQASTTVYKHVDTRNFKGKYVTAQAGDDNLDLMKALKEHNINQQHERDNRRCYRAFRLADQTWGHCIDVEGRDPDAVVHTYDYRRFYGTEFSKVPDFQFFHGYPANPCAHEFKGPIGNGSNCTPFTFGRNKFAVFRMTYIKLQGMDPGLQSALFKANIFVEEYATTYLSSPILHWLEAHGAVWSADAAWVVYCLTDTWCPCPTLYQNMIDNKTYPVVFGMLQCGRNAVRAATIVTPTKQEALDCCAMYGLEFTNETQLRIAGFDRYFHGEEAFIDPARRLRIIEESERLARECSQRKPAKRKRGDAPEGNRLITDMFGKSARAEVAPASSPEPMALDPATLPPVEALFLHSASGHKTPHAVLSFTGREADPASPHYAMVEEHVYGMRSDYGYLAMAQHGYCVVRLLQAVERVPPSSIIGYSLDSLHLDGSYDSCLEGLMEPAGVPTTGFLKAATTRPVTEFKSFKPECILSSHTHKNEHIMEKVDPLLAPAPDTPSWTLEKDAMTQFNLVTGRPGTGKTTGYFRDHPGSVDNRLPKATTILATPTNLLACDFSNKLGCNAVTLHKAISYPVGKLPEPAKTRYHPCRTIKRDAGPLISFQSKKDSVVQGRQTIVVDEVTQQSDDIIRDMVQVAKANHLQLVLAGDFCMETNRIFQMGAIDVTARATPVPQSIKDTGVQWNHVTRDKVYRQLGDGALASLLDELRESSDAEGVRKLLQTPWIPRVSGMEWLRMVTPDKDLSITPLHRNIKNVTDRMLARMDPDAKFKVVSTTKLQYRPGEMTRPAFYNRFLLEFGLRADVENTIHKGMTATITKQEWLNMWHDPCFNYSGSAKPPPTAVLYGRTYTWDNGHHERGVGTDRQNKINPLICSTAHTVQGREVAGDGKVFMLVDGRDKAGLGGWQEEFAINSVYVAASRVRNRSQLVLVDASDLL